MTAIGLLATREQIMNALFVLIKARCGDTFKYYSRRFMTWEQVVQSYTQGQPILQPALFLYDGVGFSGGRDQWDVRQRGNPTVVTLYRDVIIYAQLPGGATPGGADLTTPGGLVFHPLIEAVEAALGNDDTSQNVLSLGGLVSHCWIEGEGLMMSGEIDQVNGQGMYQIPIRIMMNPSGP